MSAVTTCFSEIWQWLLVPLSGAREHHIATQIAWHGRLMVLAWGLLSPVMIVLARYFKVTLRQDWPKYLDNPFWFLTHRRAGYWIAIVATCGLVGAVWHNQSLRPLGSAHGAFGWSLIVLGWLQVIGSRARGTHGGPINPFTRKPRPPEEWPGDHFSMTRRRVFFEHSHKALGWLLQLAALIAILTGLYKADAPRWMGVAMTAWWLAVAIVSAVLQVQGRCIDTYQAIWGLDPQLPGYRRQPIGWGITRYTSATLGAAPWPRKKSFHD
jgi:hypothetical protein